jgi:MerR family redox-sensitive transcriptional activator SoxR
MSLLTIGELARSMNVRPSAIRYYERLGVLPRAERLNGRRRYDPAALHRLAVVLRAWQAGFTLGEVRTLFFGFGTRTPAGERWRTMAARKLSELQRAAEEIRSMQDLLRRLRSRCRCTTLEDCGRAMVERAPRPARARP